ncbi:hypothetical protein WG906_02370 [Pedobacter sp. P351]|uniref:hypothetical protein n=1 Tax=Pedobacter superstes TaxID=3133441 RepID=UPI0030A90012
MKKILLMMSLVAGIVTFSMAQGGGQQGTPEERAQRSLDRIKTSASITFTPEQESKVKAILISQSKSQDSLIAVAGAGADRMAAFQKLAPIRAANDVKIMALLNDEQKKAYTTYLEARRQRMQQGGQGGATPKPAGQR